jgi:hypothetical protein
MGMQLTLQQDYQFQGLAALNLLSLNIVINPQEVDKTLNEAYPNGYNSSVKEMFTIYLTLHEIGHYKFSPTWSQLEAAIKKESDIPDNLCALCSNIVEDCVIQRAMEKLYPSKIFKKAWAIGTPIIQGNIALKDYIKTLLPGNVQQMLFYFILRGYNLTDKDVQSRWNNDPRLPWSDKTIVSFETAITTVDPVERVGKSVSEFARNVYNDLKQNNLNPPPMPMPGQGQGQGQGSQGSGQQQGQQGQGQGQSQSAQTAPNGQGGQQGQAGQSSGNRKPLSQAELDKMIQDAAAALNQKLNAIKQQLEANEQNNSGVHGSNTNTVSPRQLNDLDANVEAEFQVGQTSPESDQRYGKLNALGEQLFKIVAPIFARIHNEEPYWRKGLEDGEEIDEDALPDYFLTKDLHIYQDYCETREQRKINITFYLDDSGSMRGGQFVNCANILTALCHGFEETEIGTQIYLFGDSSRKVKDLTCPATLTGNVSNVLSALQQSYSGGGTSISDGLKHYLSQESFNDNEYINIIYILTDGCIWDTAEARQLIQELRNKGTYVKGIGLELGDSGIRGLRDWAGEATDYTQAGILRNLGDDIVDFIDDIIHHKI